MGITSYPFVRLTERKAHPLCLAKLLCLGFGWDRVNFLPRNLDNKLLGQSITLAYSVSENYEKMVEFLKISSNCYCPLV